MSALEVVPVKNDIKRCWDCFLKEELQAEHRAREVQGHRYGPECAESRTAVDWVSTPCLT